MSSIKSGSIYINLRPKWSTTYSIHIVELFHQRNCFVFSARRVMLRRAQYCYGKSSVCPSV